MEDHWLQMGLQKKRSSVYRARLVAQVYTEISGVDFSINYAPMIENATFQIVLSRIERDKMVGYALDVETAFLHGDLEEEIFMRVTDGY
jgi:Reverse transcriptase (RNA-dependent DNA polymerase)